MAFLISWSCAPGPVGVSFQGSWIDRGSQEDWPRTDSQQTLTDPTRAQRLLALKPPDGHPSAPALAQDCLSCDGGEAPGSVLPPTPHHDRHGGTPPLVAFMQQYPERTALFPQPGRTGAASLLRLCNPVSLRSRSPIPSVTSRTALLLGLLLSLLASAHPFLHREINSPQLFMAGKYFM